MNANCFIQEEIVLDQDGDDDIIDVPADDDVTNVPVYVTSVSSVNDDVIIPQGVQNSSDYYDIAELSPVVSLISSLQPDRHTEGQKYLHLMSDPHWSLLIIT